MMGLCTLERDGFMLRPHHDGEELRVDFSGCADDDVQSLLSGYFTLMHAEVQRLGLASVVVDVHLLTFINSSCFKALVAWVDRLNGTHAAERYQIRFLIHPQLHWQARSFDALHRMCLGQVSVEHWVGGKP